MCFEKPREFMENFTKKCDNHDPNLCITHKEEQRLSKW